MNGKISPPFIRWGGRAQKFRGFRAGHCVDLKSLLVCLPLYGVNKPLGSRLSTEGVRELSTWQSVYVNPGIDLLYLRPYAA